MRNFRILLIVSCLLGVIILLEEERVTHLFTSYCYVKDGAPKPMARNAILNTQSKMNKSRAQMQGSITSSGMWKTKSHHETVLLPYLQASNVCKFNVEATNCSGLFAGDEKEFNTTLAYQTEHPFKEPDVQGLLDRAQDCETYISCYIMKPLSKEEEEFPIAYSIMMYHAPVMLERLLRAIYRPQNYYCIHVDLTADPKVYSAVEAIAACFDNVILPTRRVDVVWGTYTVLEPDLICMEYLWQYKDWLYFINLTGEEFPLRTNLELVRIFKILNGANAVGVQTKRTHLERYKTYYIDQNSTDCIKPPPPINVTLAKDMTHVALSRGAADFILHNIQAQKFRSWVQTAKFPDEYFWPTLNFNHQLGMPGAYTGNVKFHAFKGHNQLVSRLKIWGSERRRHCPGKLYQRDICLMSVKLLPLLRTTPQMFVNKFRQDIHPLAYDCMEQHIFIKVLREATNHSTRLDKEIERYYMSMDFVKHHL